MAVRECSVMRVMRVQRCWEVESSEQRQTAATPRFETRTASPAARRRLRRAATAGPEGSTRFTTTGMPLTGRSGREETPRRAVCGRIPTPELRAADCERAAVDDGAQSDELDDEQGLIRGEQELSGLMLTINKSQSEGTSPKLTAGGREIYTRQIAPPL